MGDDSRGPALPRRVPGANSAPPAPKRQPPQVSFARRVPGAAKPGAAKAAPAGPGPLLRDVPAADEPLTAGAPAAPGQLPRRVPGANSAPSAPKRQPPQISFPRETPSAAAVPPASADLGSPPRDVPDDDETPTAPQPVVRLPESLPSPSRDSGNGPSQDAAASEVAAAASADDGPKPVRPVDAPAAPAAQDRPAKAAPRPERPPRPEQPGRLRHARKALTWRTLTALVASVVVILAATGLALAMSHTAKPAKGAGAAEGRQQARVAAADRRAAAQWVAHQVSPDVIVSCDPVMCPALASRGFPARNLHVLTSATSDPLGSAVIVATAEVRRLFGSRLDSAYAPAVIASFGSGAPGIQVRTIAPHGAAAYRSALSADLLARKASGTLLLHFNSIVVPAKARKELAAGQVDSRLLITIADLAGLHPVHIVSFGGSAPGAGAGIPLRYVDLAESEHAHGSVSVRYVRSMLAFMRVQRGPDFAAFTESVLVDRGQNVLRIEFAAPSPLGLLGPQGP
jgi:hypothetical protein